MTAQEQLQAAIFVKEAAALGGIGYGAYKGFQVMKQPFTSNINSYINAGKHVLNTASSGTRNVLNTAWNNSKTPWTPVQNFKRLGGALVGGVRNNIQAVDDGMQHISSTARYNTMGMMPFGRLARNFMPPPTQLPKTY